MKGLRTLVSAICILAAAGFIAWWAIATFIVNEIEEGSATRALTENALQSPELRSALAAELANRTGTALNSYGVDLKAAGLDDELESAIANAVDTEAFRKTVLDQVDEAQGQIAEQLSDESRDPAPLTVTVNLSASLNDRIDELGGVAVLAPEVAVPPVTIEILDQEQFERARTAYGHTQWAHRWAGWVGAGLIVLGMIVSPRRRWFPAKFFAVSAVICLGFGGAVALLGSEALTDFLPGGADGAVATMWRDALTAEASAALGERALWVGAALLAAALVATLIAAVSGGRRR